MPSASGTGCQPGTGHAQVVKVNIAIGSAPGQRLAILHKSHSSEGRCGQHLLDSARSMEEGRVGVNGEEMKKVDAKYPGQTKL